MGELNRGYGNHRPQLRHQLHALAVENRKALEMSPSFSIGRAPEAGSLLPEADTFRPGIVATRPPCHLESRILRTNRASHLRTMAIDDIFTRLISSPAM